MNGARWLRRASLVCLLAVLGLFVLTVRAVIEGEQELARSDRAFDEGDVRLAALHARRAAVMYAPGAPHVSRAYERLIAIATGAEAAGDESAALMAWNAVRGAALETRHVWVPHGAELRRANESLARLASAEGRLSARQRAEQHRRALGELERDDSPSAPWIGVLALGLTLLVSGFLAVLRRAVAPDGSVVLAPARLGLVLIATGLACWIAAVLRA